MAFHSSIETTFLTSLYATRETNAQDTSGNPTSAVTTICYDVLGDLQPARSYLLHRQAEGVDYQLTHTFFGDVPTTVPVEGDHAVTAGNSFAVRNVRNFKDHVELELERLGV